MLCARHSPSIGKSAHNTLIMCWQHWQWHSEEHCPCSLSEWRLQWPGAWGAEGSEWHVSPLVNLAQHGMAAWFFASCWRHTCKAMSVAGDKAITPAIMSNAMAERSFIGLQKYKFGAICAIASFALGYSPIMNTHLSRGISYRECTSVLLCYQVGYDLLASGFLPTI